ncbi:hypothetical protein ACRAWF_32405 [Streptomyces sp. L7]
MAGVYRQGSTHSVPGAALWAPRPPGRSDDEAPEPAPRPRPRLRPPRRRARARARRATPPARVLPRRPPPTPTPTPTPTDTVAKLADAGTAAHRDGGRRVRKKISTARARTSAGKGVAKVGGSGSRSSGPRTPRSPAARKVAQAVTSASPVWLSPRPLQAGETTGDFTVRATLLGRTIHRSRLPTRRASRPGSPTPSPRTSTSRADLHSGRRSSPTRSR